MTGNMKTMLFAVMLIILTSCLNQSGCIKVKLSQEEISWFSHYKNGDTVYFKNQLKEVDTFVIEVLNEPDYTVCNKFELGEYIYPTVFLRFQCLDDYTIEERRKNYHLEFYLDVGDTSNQISQKGVNFFELDVDSFREFDSKDKTRMRFQNDKDSIDVFIFKKGFNAQNQEGIVDIMHEFAITKKYGLVWYRTVKGETYERVW